MRLFVDVPQAAAVAGCSIRQFNRLVDQYGLRRLRIGKLSKSFFVRQEVEDKFCSRIKRGRKVA